MPPRSLAGRLGVADRNRAVDVRTAVALSLGIIVGACASIYRNSVLGTAVAGGVGVGGAVQGLVAECPVCTCDQGAGAAGAQASSTAAAAASTAVAVAPSNGPGADWTPQSRAGVKGDEELKALLERIANDKGEVLVAVSNSALINPEGNYGMLHTWLECVKRAGVTNYMVIALDKQVAETMEKIGVPHWDRDPAALADKNRDNHGISAQKFHLVKEFLNLGYSVLLSDVDIVTLKNPFDNLYRDSDIEGLSDGFDERTAYGWNDGIDDPSMGWARYAQTMRVFVMNSGLFYIKANERTVRFMDMITDRLKRKKEWDQAVYNEEMFFPSHGDRVNPGVTRRIMDIHDFVNSKTMFKYMRKDGRWKSHTPVMVHVNYHPDKWERMLAVVKRYVDGDKAALDKFPDGSCHNAPNC